MSSNREEKPVSGSPARPKPHSPAPGIGSRTASTYSTIQRKSNGARVADSGIEQHLAGARQGSGSSLGEGHQIELGQALGTDLSGVRIHDDSASHDAARSIGAKAYTEGQNIYFGQGHYDPTTPTGRHLLAHEAAHTAQQQGSGPAVQGKLEVTQANDPHEREADAFADALVAGRPAPAVTSAGPSIARDPDKEPEPISAREYFKQRIPPGAWTGVIEAQARIPLKGTGSPFLRWKSNGTWKLAEVVMADVAATGPSWSYVHETLGEDPERPINAGRQVNENGYGDAKNDSFVFEEFSRRYARVINAAIQRVGPKVAYEWNRALAAEETSSGANLLPEDHLPDPANVIPSHPLDRAVISGMCAGHLVFDPAAYRDAHPSERGVEGPKTVVDGVALQLLRADGTWKMVRVIDDSIDPTPEDVAKELYGDPAFAHLLIPGGTRFGFNFPPSKRLAEPYDTDWQDAMYCDGAAPIAVIWSRNNVTDGARAIIDSNDDDAVLAQSAHLPPTGADGARVAQRIQVMISIVEKMDVQAESFGQAGYLASILARLNTRYVACAADDVEAAKWDAQSNEQLEILSACATGFDAAWGHSTNMFGATDLAGQTIGVGDVSDYLNKPLREVANGFMVAAVSSELVETARSRLQVAQDRLIQYPADILQGILLYARDLVNAMKAGDKFHDVPGTSIKASALSLDSINLDAMIRPLRAALVEDPKRAGEILQELQKKIDVLIFKATLGAGIKAFDEMSSALFDNLDYDKFKEKRGKLDSARQKWVAVAADVDHLEEDDAEGVDKIRARLATLQRDTDFQEAVKYVTDAIDDQQSRDRWIAIGILIGIVVVTILSGGLAAEVTGPGAAGIIAAAFTEGLVFTTLSTAFFKQDPNAQDFIVELGINVAMFGGLRAISRAFQVAAAGEKLSMGARALEFTLENVVLDATMLAHAEYNKRRERGDTLTQSEVGDIMLLNLVLSGAASVITRIGGGFLTKLKDIRDVKAVQAATAARDKALDLAKQAKALTDPAAARDIGKQMLAADREAIRLEQEAIKELHALAKSPKAGAVKFTDEEVKLLDDLFARNAEIAQQREVTELMLRLERKGPTDYIAPADDYETLLRKHKELEAANPSHKVTDLGGSMTVSPLPVEGMPSQPFTIHRRIGTDGAAVAPQTAASQIEELAYQHWDRLLKLKPGYKGKTKAQFVEAYKGGKVYDFDTGGWPSLEVQARRDWAALKKARPDWKGLKGDAFIEEYRKGNFINVETGRWRSRAAERGGGESVTFDADVSIDEVLNVLTGADSASSFKPYFEMLTKGEYGIANVDQVRAAIERIKPGYGSGKGPNGEALGKPVADVRHQLKVTFREQIFKYIFDTEKLAAKRPDPRWQGTPGEQLAVRAEASHARMLEVTEGLNSKDASRISEIWYERANPAAMDGAVPQPMIRSAQNPTIGKIDRQPDNFIAIDKDAGEYMSHDIKLGVGEIDQAQLSAMLKLVRPKGGTKIMDGATERLVTKHRVSYLNPKAITDQAKEMRLLIEDNPNLQFEIYNTQGQSKVITRANLRELEQPALGTWLGI